jgi:zinc protease
VPREPAQTAERRVEVDYEGRTLPMLAVAYKGGAHAPGDRTYVASHALAGLAFGARSDIYRDLVLDRRLVQSLRASPASSRDPGLWTVTAQVTDAAHLPEVLAAIDATVARYQAQPPDAAELEAVTSRLRYAFLLELETPGAIAGAIAGRAAVAGSVAAIDQYYQTLATITPDDVQAAARTYLRPERRTVATLREKTQP